MKRFLALFCTVTMLFTSLLTFSSSAKAVIGDADGDGAVTSKDVAVIARYLAGWKEYVTDSGDITFPDDVSIRKSFSGHDAEGFCVGFARKEIDMPFDGTISLGGYGTSYKRLAVGKYLGNSSCSKTVDASNTDDGVFMTCVAFKDDEGEIMLLFTFDILNIMSTQCDPMREVISAKTGVPFDHINISCTHTHGSIDTHCSDAGAYGAISRFMFKMYTDAANCAQEAINDLDTSTLYIDETKTTELNFVRRYYVKYALGSLHGYNKTGFEGPNTTDSVRQYVRHETAIDEELQYVFVDRENQKDIILYNWQCHPAITSSSTDPYITADFVNSSKRKIEKDLGVYSMFFQGAAGNVATGDAVGNKGIKAESNDQKGKYTQSQQVGVSLASTLITRFNKGSYQKIDTGKIQVRVGVCDAPLANNEAEIQTCMKKTGKSHDAARDYLMQYVNEYYNACLQYGDGTTQATNAKKNLYNKTGVIASYYMLNAIKNRSGYSGTSGIRYSAFSIGKSLAFTFVSYEMFDTSAMTIKNGYRIKNTGETEVQDTSNQDKSPFGMTFVCELTNDSRGYIPTKFAYDHGGYESYSSNFASGTAELVVEELLDMLDEMYSSLD